MARKVSAFQVRFASLLLIAALSLCGQQTSATLVGSVIDPSGRVVPNAIVAATETRTGVTRNTTTTGDGVYNLPYLAPGIYRVEISAPGFKKVVRENIELSVSSTVRVDASLETG